MTGVEGKTRATAAPEPGALEAKRVMMRRTGFVPIAVTDRLAQDLLLTYANRAEAVDPAFAAALKAALSDAEADFTKQRLREQEARIAERTERGFYGRRRKRGDGR